MPYKRPSAKSLENLKKGRPFQKGVSGNPKGKPRMPDLKEAMQKVLGQEKDGKTALEAVLLALFKRALNGDVRAAELLMTRGYGLPKQIIDLDGTMQIVFKREDADH